VKPEKNNPTPTAWDGPGDRAREFIREYRALLTGYAAVPDVEKKQTRKARTPPKPPVVSDLPVEMRQLLETYKREHPGAAVQPIAYVTAGGSDAARSAARYADLPPEDDLVILALTTTVASAERVEARSQVLLLRRVEKR
jgi:alkanesulfonate monooxygenase SsuD/methylene tetrahydromethanopterin reductase-like flavin-dependent oxidoreductase (luciferase family)